jgi:hypothetical protein
VPTKGYDRAIERTMEKDVKIKDILAEAVDKINRVNLTDPHIAFERINKK